jgi:hypothetical protein
MMGQQLGGLDKNLRGGSEGPLLKQYATTQRNQKKDVFDDS